MGNSVQEQYTNYRWIKMHQDCQKDNDNPRKESIRKNTMDDFNEDVNYSKIKEELDIDNETRKRTPTIASKDSKNKKYILHKHSNSLIKIDKSEKNDDFYSLFYPVPISLAYNLEQKWFKIKNNPKQENPFKIDIEKSCYYESENEVIHREKLPINNYKIFRPIRLKKNSFKIIQQYKFNFLENLTVFYFSEIFDKFDIDLNDNFILKFANHCTLINDELKDVILKYLPEHLGIKHNLNNERFTFSKLRNVLANDFSNNKSDYKDLSLYGYYFIRNLNRENFKEIISQILIEQGEVFTIINKIISNKYIKVDFLFYLLCLFFIYDTETNNKQLDVTYKTLDIVNCNMFKEENLIMNFGFMSTVKDKNIINYSNTNIVEITYDLNKNKNRYLSFKGLDTENFSQYPSECEVILQPYCVFEVKSVKLINNNNNNTINTNYNDDNRSTLSDTSEKNYYYIKLHMLSNCISDCSELNMSMQMQMSLGLCLDIGNDIFENYPHINLKNIASLTVKNKENLFNNFKHIKQMTNLRILDLRNLDLNDDDLIKLLPVLSNLNFLTYINLSQNNLGPTSIKEFSKIFCLLPFLENLILNQNNLGDRGTIFLSENLKILKNLRNLNLKYNHIRYKGLESISSSISNLKKINNINLSINKFSYEDLDNLIYSISNFSNLVSINLSNNFILSEGILLLSEVLPSSIQFLDFSESKIEQEGISELAKNFYKMPNLLSLILYGNKNGSIGIELIGENLKYIPKLKHLHLGCNCISDSELLLLSKYFDYLSNLEIFNLRENQISNEGILYVSEQLKKLENLGSLDIAWNDLNENCVDYLSKILLNDLPNLYSLNVEGDPISLIGRNTLMIELKNRNNKWVYNKGEFSCKNDNKLQKFAELYIHQNKSYVDEIFRASKDDLYKNLNHLNKYEHVKKIYITRIKLEIESLNLLSDGFKFLSKLKELDMRCNEIGNEGMIILSRGLRNVPLLEIFVLRENNIGEDGMKVFCENLIYLKQLKCLDLDWNIIMDNGLIYLSNVKFNELQVLKLKENSIGKKGIIEFSQKLDNFVSLKHLDLCWNNFGNEGIIEFSKYMYLLKNMTYLQISNSEIGDIGITEFSKNFNVLNNLDTLLLMNNKIGNIGGSLFFEEIIKSKSLKNIDISLNTMTEEIKDKYRSYSNKAKINIDI